jgi:hypothetical protein
MAQSRHLQAEGLGVLLDTLADRLLRATPHAFAGAEADQLAFAAMAVLHRDVVDLPAVQAWIDRLAAGWAPYAINTTLNGPVPAQVRNTIAFARALHLQLLLGVRAPRRTAPFAGPPAARVEVLGALQAALRTSGPYFEPGRLPGSRK